MRGLTSGQYNSKKELHLLNLPSGKHTTNAFYVFYSKYNSVSAEANIMSDPDKLTAVISVGPAHKSG
jgi:hypothetical protein